MGKKSGKGKIKFVKYDPNNLSESPGNKPSNKKTKDIKGNGDSTSIEKYPMTPTSDILDSSADISIASNSTRGDESTDSSTKLFGHMDEFPAIKNKSNCSESEINLKNYKPEKLVKNGIQNLSVSSHSDESFQKDDAQVENRGSSIECRNNAKDSNKGKRKGGQCYDSSNFHNDANVSDMPAKGEPDRETPSVPRSLPHSNAWGDKSVRKYDTQIEKRKNTNTSEYTDRIGRKNETSNQDECFKGKAVNNYRKSTPDGSGNFSRQRNINEASRSQDEICSHASDTDKQKNIEDSEDWDAVDWDAKDVPNYSNQNLVETDKSSAGNDWSRQTQSYSKKCAPRTGDDFFDNKFPQKSKTDQNWRSDRKSLPTMSSHDQNSTKRYSEGNKDGSNRGGLSRWLNKNSNDSWSENTDAEYKQFRDEEKRKKKIEFVRVEEIQQDLFTMPKEYSLGHCVAEDMRMGSGIAVVFKREFKQLDCLLDQRPKQGGVAVLEDKSEEGTRYLYYLVTKRESTGKPTYDKFWSSLQKMRNHIRENGVKKLAIPRLGCGLDRLDWDRVKHMIEFLFKDIDVKITVCNFQQNHGQTKQKLQRTSDPDNSKKSKSKKKKK